MIAHIIELFFKRIKIEYISFVAALKHIYVNAYKVHIHIIVIIISVAEKKHLHGAGGQNVMI